MSVGNSEAATVSLQREQVLLREDVVIHKMNFLAYYFFLLVIPIILVFPGGTCGKEPTCQYRRHKRHEFDPWVGKIPWRRAWQPTPVFLPRESLWTEEPGGLQFMGLQRIGHDRAVDAHTVYLPGESHEQRSLAGYSP